MGTDMKTYDMTEVELVLAWADNYFEVKALINNLFGGPNFRQPFRMPSFEAESEYQRLRLWFCKNHVGFVPIWADYCSSKGRPIKCTGPVDGMEYGENPFLYYYYPDSLLDLAYTIGATSAVDIWDPDKQSVELIININNIFSKTVTHLKYWIEEFAEIKSQTYET